MQGSDGLMGKVAEMRPPRGGSKIRRITITPVFTLLTICLGETRHPSITTHINLRHLCTEFTGSASSTAS